MHIDLSPIQIPLANTNENQVHHPRCLFKSQHRTKADQFRIHRFCATQERKGRSPRYRLSALSPAGGNATVNGQGLASHES
jgi:hypothetical protein